MATKPKGAPECLPCNNGKHLLWTFVWQGVAYQSGDHGKITAKRRALKANTAELRRRPKQANARQV